MDGFIVVDKPAGVTSHDVVRAVRRMAREKKVGHTGTLDPFATGVLPLALGEGTKAIPFLDESVKEYQAVMRLGSATDTQDCTGRVIAEGAWQQTSSADVEEVARRLVGRVSQVPPMFSALKRDGVPLYKLARRGESVERMAREIDIFSLVIDRIDLPEVAFTVSCSRGTYVRTLASDMGEMLGCGAHLVALRRTRSGPFSLAEAVSLEYLSSLAAEDRLAAMAVSPYAALPHLIDLPMTENGVLKVARGIAPQVSELAGFPAGSFSPGVRVRLSRGDKLLAVAEQITGSWVEGEKNLRLLRVFN